MRNNAILKLICSIPVIILALCFLPIVGVCLIILRNFVYSNSKNYKTAISIIVVGAILLLPNAINWILNTTSQAESITIPYLKEIVNSEIYLSLYENCEFIITVGVIYLIVSFAISKLTNKATNFVKSYIRKQEQIDREVAKENNLKIKEKQERAKHTKIMRCPHCGAHNVITEKTGVCSFCRKAFENDSMK